jgi:hypothetical protein
MKSGGISPVTGTGCAKTGGNLNPYPEISKNEIRAGNIDA